MTPSCALLLASLLVPQSDRSIQRRITPVVEVVRQARPAVVYIQSNVPSPPGRDFWGRLFRMPDSLQGGSGVVIYDDGYIMTNNHVVEGANKITVRFDEADRTPHEYEARIISRVPEEDLALLKIDGGAPFETIPLSSSDPILGEDVIAIGNPYGQTHTVSTGIVSGLHRDVEASQVRFKNLIQTDASINPGNSGGPLLNVNGELIGINTVMNVRAENIGFAIPIDRVRRVLREELLSPTRARAWLGYEVGDRDLRVVEVVPGGPAARAGVRPGDRVLSIGGKEIENEEDYRLARVSVQPRAQLALELDRRGQRLTCELEPWSALDGFLFERLGLTVEPILIGQAYEPLVRVERVQPTGPADDLGLRPGDVIGAVKPERGRALYVHSSEDLAFVVRRLETGGAIELEIWRDDDDDGVFEFEREARYSELYRGSLTVR